MNGKIQLKSLDKKMFSLRTVLFLFCIFSSPFSRSEEPLSGGQGQGEYKTIEESFLETNASISEWFVDMADGLDMFLAGQRYTKKTNKTSVTIEFEGAYTRFDNTSSGVNFNGNLRLPNVEEYWLLTFTSYDDAEERGARQKYLRQNRRTTNYGASLGLIKKMGEVKTSFRPRITFEGTPAISHSLKFESIADMRTYKVNPELELYATPSKGAGIFHSLNFNWILTKIWSLTWVNEGDYQSRPHLYTVTQGLSLGQQFNPRMALGYNMFITSINQPNYQLDGYNFSLSWHHILYKDMLDYKLIPNIDFSQAYGFVVNPGVNMVIGLHF
ncbi:MAG: hypothetical protein HUU57_03730 [Bdellovibrio sp.]|nr:hypothetical protein [Bdellovibrio sp.]